MLALRLLAYWALVFPTDVDFAPGVGATGFVLVGPLEIGASASGESQLFNYNRWGVASHLGLRAPLGRLELDAAATLGYTGMHHGGPSVLGANPGTSGDTPFVGGRAGIEYAVYRSEDEEERVSLGLIFNYEHDLSQYTQQYSYEDTGWLSDEVQTYTDSARIGMDRIAVQIAAGIGFN
jgi:hypothetical protein